jgi:hypothetical protein
MPESPAFTKTVQRRKSVHSARLHSDGGKGYTLQAQNSAADDVKLFYDV